MNNYSRFLKKFLFVGLLAVFGVMNGYGQADDCICIQNDDADFLVQGCEPYDFTKDYSSGSKNDILCISNGGANQVDLNKLGAGDVLHIIATDKTIEFTTNRGNHAAKIYIHEKVKVHVLANGIQGVSVYNRGTMTTAGELEMNGELLNVGSLTVNGKLGNLNHRFSNYGNVVVNGQLGQIQGDIFCVGSNSVTTVNTIGDFNSSENKAISTTGDGGYINVKNGFGNFNEKVTSSTNLHIRLAPGVTPTIDPDDPRWGTADVEYGLYEGCNFIPIITPNTFIPGTPTLFTAGYLVDGVEAIDPKFQWMINDTPIEGATSATYTATLEADDKISCAVSNGDGTCLKPSNGVSLSAAEYDPVANITVSFPEGVTVTNHEIDLCNLSLNTGEKITFEVKSEFTGLSPKYQWYVGSTLQPGETGKTFVYDPAELTPGSPVEIYCEVTADFPCADPINPRPFIKRVCKRNPDREFE